MSPLAVLLVCHVGGHGFIGVIQLFLTLSSLMAALERGTLLLPIVLELSLLLSLRIGVMMSSSLLIVVIIIGSLVIVIVLLSVIIIVLLSLHLCRHVFDIIIIIVSSVF